MKKDYYKVLGVERSASDAAIKQRYRDLSKQNHPDVNGGDHTAMMKINEAYAVLSNPTKRRNYDFEYDAKHGTTGSFTDGSVKQQTYSPSPDKRSPYKRPPAPQKPKNPSVSGLSILGYGFGVLVAMLVLAYVIVAAG